MHIHNFNTLSFSVIICKVCDLHNLTEIINIMSNFDLHFSLTIIKLYWRQTTQYGGADIAMTFFVMTYVCGHVSNLARQIENP